MSRMHPLLTGALVLLMTACSGPATGPSAESPSAESPSAEVPIAETPMDIEGIAVQGATAHLLPGGHGAIYFEVLNGGPEDRLLAVETPLAEIAELHESLEEGGVMRMVAHPDGFLVPTAGRLQLAPGGKHVMLMQIRPVEETTVPLTLRFERAGAVEVQAQILAPAGGADSQSMDHGSMDHGAVGSGAMNHGSMDHDAMDHDAMDHESMDHGKTEPIPDAAASSPEASH